MKAEEEGGLILRFRGNLFLTMAAFIWGTTFVAQHVSMESLGPFTYAAARYFLGFLFVLILWFFSRGQRTEKKQAGTYHSGWKTGIGAGLIMFAASSLQQVGMVYTTAGKASFITCLYIIFVPVFSVFLGRKIRWENWLSAALAMSGLYLLCVKADLSFSAGDAIIFVCSVFWTFHILFIGRYAELSDCIEMSVAQLGVCFLGSLAGALLLESIVWADLWKQAFPIFYGGVMSSGIAFTLQIIGQRYAAPSHAAIIMSLESVFGAVASWIILQEEMNRTEIFGCALMFAGMLFVQLCDYWKDRRRHAECL